MEWLNYLPEILLGASTIANALLGRDKLRQRRIQREAVVPTVQQNPPRRRPMPTIIKKRTRSFFYVLPDNTTVSKSFVAAPFGKYELTDLTDTFARSVAPEGSRHIRTEEKTELITIKE